MHCVTKSITQNRNEIKQQFYKKLKVTRIRQETVVCKPDRQTDLTKCIIRKKKARELIICHVTECLKCFDQCDIATKPDEGYLKTKLE